MTTLPFVAAADTDLARRLAALEAMLGPMVAGRIFLAPSPAGLDMTAAFNAAIQSLPHGGTIMLAPGYYHLAGSGTGVLIDRPINISGSGSAQTYLGCGHASVDLFTVTTQMQCKIMGLRIDPDAGVVRTGGSYIKVDPGPGKINYLSLFDDVAWSGAWTGLNMVRAASWHASHLTMLDVRHANIVVENRTDADIGDSSITESLFSYGTGAHVVQHSSGGLRLVNNKWLGGTYGYQLDLDSNSLNAGPYPGTSILLASGISMEQQTIAHMAFGRSAGNSTFSLVEISGANEFAYAPKGIVLDDPGNAVLYSINLQGGIMRLIDNAIGIDITGGRDIQIDDWKFAGAGLNTTAIRKAAAAGVTLGTGNSYTGVTTPVLTV